MIYIGTFVLSIVFFAFAIKYEKNLYLKIFFLSFSIMIPTLLAAVRDVTVGTDVLVYIQRWFLAAKKINKIKNFFKYCSTEPLYALLTYLCGKIFKNIAGLFAIIELLVLIPTYVAIWKLKNYVHPMLALTVYYFVFYCHSYNTARQCIAMSFLFLGTVCLFMKKNLKFWICGIVAVGFHYSSIIFLGLFVMYNLFNTSMKKWLSRLLIVAISIAMLFYDVIFKMVCSFVPFFPKRYLAPIYLYKEWDWPIADTFVIGLAFLIGIGLMKDKESKSLFLGVMMVFSLVGLFVDTSALFASRIFWYFHYFMILTLPQGAKLLKNNRLNREGYTCFLLLILVAYWWAHFIYTGPRTWPYVFA